MRFELTTSVRSIYVHLSVNKKVQHISNLGLHVYTLIVFWYYCKSSYLCSGWPCLFLTSVRWSMYCIVNYWMISITGFICPCVRKFLPFYMSLYLKKKICDDLCFEMSVTCFVLQNKCQILLFEINMHMSKNIFY